MRYCSILERKKEERKEDPGGGGGGGGGLGMVYWVLVVS